MEETLEFSPMVVSEYSMDRDNRIDFQIEDPKWGIEILREGERLDGGLVETPIQSTEFRLLILRHRWEISLCLLGGHKTERGK